jgi:hypothetical protein
MTLQDHYYTKQDIENVQKTVGKGGLTHVDIGYVISFDPNDLKKLNKFYQYIKTARENNNLVLKNELIQYYEQFLTREYQDQTVSYEWIPEPLEIASKFDRVVFSGLERIADLATGKSDLTFNYYSIGTGSSPVLPSDIALDFEESRVPISETGFAESKGSSMVFSAYFPTTLPSMSVTESGIFDRFTSPSTMLLRTIYTGTNVVSHVFNQKFVAVSHFVYQLSV